MNIGVGFNSLGSNRLTLVLLLLLLFSVSLYQYLSKPLALTTLLLVSGLLMLNLIAGMIRRKVLVNKPALLVFHLALFLLVVELVISQLTYLKGNTEVGTLEEFDGRINNIKAGPWHNYQLDQYRFTNLGFEINYHAGIQRDNTLNRIRLESGENAGNIIEIGDHQPLVLGHYRLYTSFNKGYAPVFTWSPNNGVPAQRGSIHLPAYPIHEYQQALEWNLPGTGQLIWTMLVIEENVLPEDRDFSFSIPHQHHVVIRMDDQRFTLRPGEHLDLPAGRLKYDHLSSWMGYTVDYDWTRPWLLATCLLAMVSLALHYLLKISRSGFTSSEN